MSSGTLHIDNFKTRSSQIGDDLTIELLDDCSIIVYSEDYFNAVNKNSPCYEKIFDLIYCTDPVYCINERLKTGIIFHETDDTIYFFDLQNNIFTNVYSFERDTDGGFQKLYYHEYNDLFVIFSELITFCFNVNDFKI